MHVTFKIWYQNIFIKKEPLTIMLQSRTLATLLWELPSHSVLNPDKGKVPNRQMQVRNPTVARSSFPWKEIASNDLHESRLFL